MSDGGLTIVGGGHPDVVDTAEMERAVTLLDRVADHLDVADRALAVAVDAARPALVTEDGRAASAALHSAREGSASPGRCAHEARAIGRCVRAAVVTYDSAESGVHRLMRVVVGGEPMLDALFPTLPLARPLLGLATAGAASVALRAGALETVLRAVWAVPAGRADDVVRQRVRTLQRLAAVLVADGRAELLTLGLATTLLGPRAARIPPDLRVPLLVRQLAWLLPEPSPTVVVPRVGAAQLPAPRDLAMVVANVGRSYRDGSVAAVPGTPDGTITIQRLQKPDGSVSWVVAVPGTQSPGLNGVNPMDVGTDARLEGDLPESMTPAVIEAMRLAGIREDDPVMLAGHSQGGMVATSVASALAGTYRIAAVLTVGSPDIPRGPMPPGVQVLHVRDSGDIAPQSDGRPDRGTSNVRVVSGEAEAAGAPPVRNLVEAHSVARYVRLTEAVDAELDDPQLRDFARAAQTVLGPPGTTATTQQFVATRDPDVVATDQITGLPRPDRLAQGGPLTAPPGRSR
ncbi:hypothetical protein OMK64_18240 [Cellulomonas fimi]|uniref:hypothetical protein n=1 Tax=Cellulomonas fimi TaxID=1708 RepID=UPI00234CC0C0|nr:hypothetical protein [Cellulomonas fimi]MDC7123475.1 hypothetical protein [Cellulomonas fimi]